MRPKSFIDRLIAPRIAPWIAAEELPLLLAATMIGCTAAGLVSRALLLPHGMIPVDFETFLGQWARARESDMPYTGGSAWNYAPGILALARFLPSDPVAAWQLAGGLSIALLTAVLLLCVRYRDLRSVARMVLGLVLAWPGILEVLERGQPDLLVFGLAATAAASFETAPVFCGLLLGFLPGFKLFWTFLFVPFALASRMERRKQAHRFRRFLTGYLTGWLLWASVLPSLTFGRDRALRLSQAWVQTLRSQPSWIFGSETNQSLWAVASRMGLSPLLALGLAAIVAGVLLGGLVMRSQRAATGRINRTKALAWVSPWLLYIYWVSPMAWRWGSIFAIGLPLSWDRESREPQWHGIVRLPTRLQPRSPLRTLHSPGQMVRWTLGMWLLFLWALQQGAFLKFFGIQDPAVLVPYGIVSFYWSLMLGLTAISFRGA